MHSAFAQLPQEAFPWWVAELEAGRSIVVPDLDALPPEASAERAILADQGIQSAVVVPLVSRGRSSGFVGFDAVHHPRSWDADVIALLALVGDILLGALEHARSEQLREESAARYRLLADNARDMIWRTDLDLRFEFVNPAVKRLLQREPEELVGGTIERICDSKTHRRMREWLERARAELGDLVVEAKIPSPGAPKASSYEGEGHVILRHEDTERVRDGLRRVVQILQVELAAP